MGGEWRKEQIQTLATLFKITLGREVNVLSKKKIQFHGYRKLRGEMDVSATK